MPSPPPQSSFRRIDYDAIPGDAYFQELSTRQFVLARSFAVTGASRAELAEQLDVSLWYVRSELGRLQEDVGCTSLEDYRQAVQTGRVVLVELPGRQRRKQLTRTVRPVSRIKETSGV